MAQRARHRSKARKSPPPPPAAEIVARIGEIGARGDGVALVEGGKVFAPFAAPGDLARITHRGERGEITEILEPGPDRRAPPCDLFGRCGGCALQHVTQEFYRDWKRRLVTDALAREGFEESLVAPLVACPPASRRRASFAIRKTAGGLVFGFNARGSAEIVDVRSCPVLAPGLGALLPALRGLAAATPARWRRFDMAVTLCDNGADVDFAGGDAADDLDGREIMALTDAARAGAILRVTVAGAPAAMFSAPVVRFGDNAVALPPGAFLQASAEGEAALAAFVTSAAAGAKRIADLFCGCGTFSLPLAANSAVDAFDADAAAIAALDAAARSAAQRHPLRAMRRNLFDRPLTADELKVYDAIVLDPPRAGARAQAEAIAASNAPLVIGVSCNPASFARDAAILRAGGYRLIEAVPIDQFVFTPHVELAALFRRD